MLRQFDVVRNPSETSRKFAPFLVVLQSDLTMTETTVVVAPLILQSRLPAASRLFPAFEIEGRPLVLSSNELGAIRHKRLGVPIANLGTERARIVAALDLLFLGI